ncbi:MAG: OmpH family outer membrane protein [Bacteroidia bacterium]|nr:OmpH family outer membrane protein [Bacteroidia bacterium]
MTQAQNKPIRIGYTNVEYLLALMPESKQLENAMKTHENKIKEQLTIKQSYAQGKLEEYYKLAEQKKLTPADEEARKKELLKLEEEIKKFSEESEANYLAKREELLKPIIEKLQKAIDAVAAEEGYTIILNSTNGAGVSIILHAPEQDNCTEKIMKKMGLTAPAGSTPPKVGNK